MFDAPSFNVVLAGVGEQASTNLVPALLQLPGVRLVGVCEPDAARRSAAVHRFGIGDHDRSLERLLGRVDADAVVAACPPQAHEQVIETAVGQGLPVFVEKPPAVTSAALDRLAGLAERVGLVTGVGMNFRHAGPYQRIKELLTSAEVGSPVSVVVRHLANKPKAALWGLSPLRSFLFAQAIHPVDLLLDLGGPIERASVVAGSTGGSGLVMDVQVKFASGAVGTVHTGSLAPRFDSAIELVTNRGVTISLLRLSELTISGLPAAHAAGGSRGWSQQWRPSPLDSGYERTGFLGELAGFVAAVACGGSFTPSLSDLRPTYGMLDTIEAELSTAELRR